MSLTISKLVFVGSWYTITDTFSTGKSSAVLHAGRAAMVSCAKTDTASVPRLVNPWARAVGALTPFRSALSSAIEWSSALLGEKRMMPWSASSISSPSILAVSSSNAAISSSRGTNSGTCPTSSSFMSLADTLDPTMATRPVPGSIMCCTAW
ncbi:hypothetical protein BCR44DRAFT_1439263 [Catenaria anguillulae PL171]|uniref:Uncharacterized protein n=1 Tax=Catenaria anguillulae PL171 TaxID=765915 RepID=A0A1Y2HH16_9FUNG|nr:hypothetical protein BCR44DRAFT_1439263 [Catenaria anguillulae PL171]